MRWAIQPPSILRAAGALAGAGAPLIDPVGRIALALAGAAASVLHQRDAAVSRADDKTDE
jgi:hypothetical protein